MQILVLTRRRMDQFPAEAWTDELIAAEAARVRELYAAGSVRSIWRRKDMPGAVLLLEAASEEDARALVATFPLARRGMLEFVVVTQLEPLPGIWTALKSRVSGLFSLRQPIYNYFGDRIRMAYPANYKYTKEHEWIDATAGTVGITDYAQNSLGDIVFVELPKVGDELEAGNIFGSVESVKAVSDLYSPVSGTVTAVNEELQAAPEKVNVDANGTWLLKLTLKDAAELDKLLSASDYEAFTAEETGH